MERLTMLASVAALAALAGAAPAIAAPVPGTPDRSFGARGFLFSERIPATADGDAYSGFRLLDDGAIQVRGTSRCGMDCAEGVLVRFAENGRYVSRGRYPWRSDGEGPDPAPPWGVATLSLPDGRLIATYDDPASGRPHVLRIISPDATAAGTTVSREVALPTAFTPLSVTPDGGVLGYASRVDNGGVPAGNTVPTLVRLGPDLAPDASFGTGGRVALPPEILRAGPASARATRVRVAGWDGKALLHGLFDQSGALLRVTRVPVGRTSPNGAVARQLLVRNGRSLVVGWSDTPARGVIVAFGADGRRDRGFGRSGMLRVAEGVRAVLQRDGRIVTVGSRKPPKDSRSGAQIVLRRFTANGRPDPTFPTRSYRTRARWLTGLDAAIDRRGRIVVVTGLTTASWSSGVLLARFHGGTARAR